MFHGFFLRLHDVRILARETVFLLFLTRGTWDRNLINPCLDAGPALIMLYDSEALC